jgi:virginiamycin B lyase
LPPPCAARIVLPICCGDRPGARRKVGQRGARTNSSSRRILMIRKSLVSAAALACLVLPARAQEDFPDGPGKDVVVGVCGGCHDTNRLRAGYTPDGWRTVTAMMRNFGALVPDGQWPVVTDYLIKNFPEHPRPAAVIIPGPVEASLKEWPLPTPGSRPHDPMVAHDGNIWYTGQLANALGRLNPTTGQFTEYKLKHAQTAPHGLAEDKDGNVWFTGNFAGLIGKLDPKTGDVAEYKLPDPAAKDPHTLVFDDDGILWFTVQQGNRVGRLDPKTGDIKLVTPPTENARPYGMAVNSKNVVFFVEFGANKVARIDNKTMKITEYPLPDSAARPRRIAIGPDDLVWYTDFARGYLGRLDPATGKVSEWKSPSGPKSQPYGIVFTKGALWYNESGAKPNTIVRFDPKTEEFQSWSIPGGGDIVRNMAVTRDGNPVMANSLANAVGLVTVK